MTFFNSGIRRSDDVEVAIKRLSKHKVIRWGRIDGRAVPIEFELLHKANLSGNKSKSCFKLYTFFEIVSLLRDAAVLSVTTKQNFLEDLSHLINS